MRGPFLLAADGNRQCKPACRTSTHKHRSACISNQPACSFHAFLKQTPLLASSQKKKILDLAVILCKSPSTASLPVLALLAITACRQRMSAAQHATSTSASMGEAPDRLLKPGFSREAKTGRLLLNVKTWLQSGIDLC